MDFTTGVKHHKCFRVELFFQIWLPYNKGMKYVGLLGPNWASPNGSAGECPKQDAGGETAGLLLDKQKLNFSIPRESQIHPKGQLSQTRASGSRSIQTTCLSSKPPPY